MVDVFVEAIDGQNDYAEELSRFDYETLCRPIFEKIYKPLDQALEDSKLDKDQIDDIVIVGGSTRIPQVQTMLSTYFNNKELNRTANPDLVVAEGATICANMIANGEQLTFF